MTRLVSGLIIAFVSANSIAAVPKMCPIAGEAIHWQADYCLYEVGTDDIIAADPCLDREAKKSLSKCVQGKSPLQALDLRADHSGRQQIRYRQKLRPGPDLHRTHRSQRWRMTTGPKIEQQAIPGCIAGIPTLSR